MKAATITLKQLQVDAFIGVYDWEHKIPQRLLMDIALQVDIESPANSDDLSDAVDYTALAKCVRDFCQRQHYALLEKLVVDLAACLQAQYNVFGLALQISKAGALPNAAAVVMDYRCGTLLSTSE